MLHEQQETILMRSSVQEGTHLLLACSPCLGLHRFCATGVSRGLATRVTWDRWYTLYITLSFEIAVKCTIHECKWMSKQMWGCERPSCVCVGFKDAARVQNLCIRSGAFWNRRQWPVRAVGAVRTTANGQTVSYGIPCALSNLVLRVVLRSRFSSLQQTRSGGGHAWTSVYDVVVAFKKSWKTRSYKTSFCA
jgi:hypothetical protein